MLSPKKLALINPRHFTFWLKSALYRLTPGGFGQYRKLLKARTEEYVHERDKHPVREKHNGQGGWKDEVSAEGVRARDYASYEEYLTHQKQKLEEMMKMKGGFSNETVLNFRVAFYSRFRHLPKLLPSSAQILCGGARQGTEVEVLRDLGFANAMGIDLNPGPDNPYVKPGDFMKLDYADGALDLFYTNCIDHAFDLDRFFGEHARAIKSDGYALYDIHLVNEKGGGAFEAISWTRSEDVLVKALQYFREIVHVERDGEWLWVLLRKGNMPAKSA